MNGSGFAGESGDRAGDAGRGSPPAHGLWPAWLEPGRELDWECGADPEEATGASWAPMLLFRSGNRPGAGPALRGAGDLVRLLEWTLETVADALWGSADCGDTERSVPVGPNVPLAEAGPAGVEAIRCV